MLRYPVKLIIIMVALMSGSLSLLRELYGMYRGTLPQPNLFWMCTGAAFVISACMLLWEEYTARKKAEKSLADIMNTRPRIILKQPNPFYVQVVQFTSPSGSFAAPFLKMRFVNTPSFPYPSANAEGVKADIKFSREGENSPLLEMEGRMRATE